MRDFFQLLCMLSASGCILMLLLLILKGALKKYVKQTVFFYLWCIVLFRFILPIPSVIMRSPTIGVRTESATIKTIEPVGLEKDIVSTSGKEAEGIEKEEPSTNTPKEQTVFTPVDTWNIAAWGWLIGMLVIGIYRAVAYTQFKKSIMKRSIIADSWVQKIMTEITKGKSLAVLRSDKVQTPMLVGSKIILPADLTNSTNEQVIQNVLQHEWIHYKSKDILLKWGCLAVTTIHWFNPLMWVLNKEFEKACELACDERVTSKMSFEEKVLYGETLLQLSRKPIHANEPTLAMSKEKKYMKERLVSIMGKEVKNSISLVLSIILVVALAGCAAITGTPQQTESKNYDDNSGETSNEKTGNIGDILSSGQTPVYKILDEDKILNPDKYLQEQAAKAVNGYTPPVLILVESAYSSTSTIPTLPPVALEKMAQEIVRTAYDLTGCQIEKCYYQPNYVHETAVSFSFSMAAPDFSHSAFLTGTINTKSSTIYDVYINYQPFMTESSFSGAETPYSTNSLKRPEGYKIMSDVELAEWYFSNLSLAQGKKIVDVHRDLTEGCEAIQIYLDDGTCYEIYFTGERVPQMLYGPFDGKHNY